MRFSSSLPMFDCLVLLAGACVPAAIVERVPGKSYEEYGREQLLVPAGMNRTGHFLPTASPGYSNFIGAYLTRNPLPLRIKCQFFS